MADRASMNTLSRRGFTLIELAIVLVIVGLLIGIGSGMVGVLSRAVKVRESKELLDAAMQSVTSWASANNRIPDTVGFTSAVKTPTDAWGRDFIYLYDTNLNINPTKDTICGRRSTALTVVSADPAATISNVAFVAISKSDDAAVDTKLTGTLNNPNPTVLSNEIIPSSGYVTPTAPAPTATITLDANNNDIVRWVTLDELRTKAGCQGAPLKIINNELPYGYENTKYVAKLQLDGGVIGAGYKWCINGIPSIPPNLKAGLAGTATNTDACAPLMPTSCATLASDTNWVTTSPPVFMTISGIPTTRGSYNIKVMAHDSNSATLSQTNCTEKNFVLTINPSP